MPERPGKRMCYISHFSPFGPGACEVPDVPGGKIQF